VFPSAGLLLQAESNFSVSRRVVIERKIFLKKKNRKGFRTYSGNGKVFKKGNQERTLVGLAASTAGIPMRLMLDCRIRYCSKDAGKPPRKCHPGGHPTSSIQASAAHAHTPDRVHTGDRQHHGHTALGRNTRSKARQHASGQIANEKWLTTRQSATMQER